jgi:hypothetical protein
MFKESKKNLKATLGLSFFIILVSRGRKRDKLPPFKPLNNECERKKDHSAIFSCLESLKRYYRIIQGVPFSYNLYESEKVIKVYSFIFSCICECEKEQRLSS